MKAGCSLCDVLVFLANEVCRIVVCGIRDCFVLVELGWLGHFMTAVGSEVTAVYQIIVCRIRDCLCRGSRAGSGTVRLR